MFLELPEESQIEVIMVQKGTRKPWEVVGISHDPPFKIWGILFGSGTSRATSSVEESRAVGVSLSIFSRHFLLHAWATGLPDIGCM